MITVYADVYSELIDVCVEQVERGVAVELLLNANSPTLLESNPFLLHKCLQLINKGAAVFLMTPRKGKSLYGCIADFEKAWDIFSDRVLLYTEEKNLAEIQRIGRDFDQLKGESAPYLVEGGDIRLQLSASEYVIMKGDMIEIKWDVDLADKIVIQGIGQVNAYGSKRLKIEKSTILKIGAYNARQSQIRAVKIWVSEEVKISYDIGFLSFRTNAYCSLVQADNYPHIYGVAMGSAVRLQWQVVDASDVKIFPFNLTTHEGEHVFTPVQSMKIEIRARVQGKVLTRKITLMIFPIPIFRDKLVPLMKNIEQRYQFTLPAELKLGYSKHLRAMLKREQVRYRALRANLYDHYFDLKTKRFNLKRVNSFLFNFLKRTYSQRSSILNVIQSIQDYYNYPKPRS